MLQRVLFVLIATFGLASCSSDPDWVVLATPQTGDQYQIGKMLFNKFSDGLGSAEGLVLKAGDSACDAQTAERLAKQIVQSDATIKLVIGPLCFEAFVAAQPILAQAEIPQLPLIPTRNWESQMEMEAEIISRFARDIMQSKDTIIAYIANQYGNTMAEKLHTALGDSASLFPLANLKQTTKNETDELVRKSPSVLIVVGEYPKSKLLVEGLVSRGSNSVLVMTSSAQPALIVSEIGGERLNTARFPAAIERIDQAINPFETMINLDFARLESLLEEDKIHQEDIDQLGEPPRLRMVRVERDGTLAFDLGL